MSRLPIASIVLSAGATALIAGCAASGRASSDGARAEVAVSGKGAAQLWTENCSRCHNLRSPDYYSPGRWAMVTQHMRVRGYLTGEEERQIGQFLQAQ